MEDPELQQVRYARMRWNTPLSESHAARLLERLEVGRHDAVLDLGCRWGELLLRAVGEHAATGLGVDTAASLLERGRMAAADRGLADRVRFVQGRAEQCREAADRVVCRPAGARAAAADHRRRLAGAGSQRRRAG